MKEFKQQDKLPFHICRFFSIKVIIVGKLLNGRVQQIINLIIILPEIIGNNNNKKRIIMKKNIYQDFQKKDKNSVTNRRRNNNIKFTVLPPYTQCN